MRKLLLLFLCAVLLNSPGFSQGEESYNADSLLLVARELAFDGQYVESIDISEKIIADYPDYTDVRMLLARTYAWSGNYNEAQKHVSIVLEKNPYDYDANNAALDFYLWDEDYDSATSVANRLLNYYPNDADILTKKIRVYIAENNNNDALATLKVLEEADPNSESLEELKNAIPGVEKKNIIRLEHYHDRFNEPFSRRWHMSSVGYGRRTSHGVFYGKVYWGDMIGTGESLFSNSVSTQYSLELYPEINEFNYFFLNYSFSNDNFFPRTRLGFEYYHGFKNKFEISLGYRYLDFLLTGGNHLNINIYTGSLSKYLGKYWISARPYIVDNGTDLSYKYMLSIRRSLKKEESYLEMVLGTGVSPDNPLFYTSGQNIPQLGSWRVELEWKQKVVNSFIFEIEGAYENAEYSKDVRRDQYSIRTSLSFLF